MKVDTQGLGGAAMLLVHAKMLAPSMFIAGTTDLSRHVRRNKSVSSSSFLIFMNAS